MMIKRKIPRWVPRELIRKNLAAQKLEEWLKYGPQELLYHKLVAFVFMCIIQSFKAVSLIFFITQWLHYVGKLNMHQILDIPLYCDYSLVSLLPFSCSLEEMKECIISHLQLQPSTALCWKVCVCACVTGGGGGSGGN